MTQNTVEAKKNLWQKLSKIQSMKIDIVKDKAAHGYSYATLDQIMDLMGPILHENGLVVYHTTDYDKEISMQYLETTIKDIDNPEDLLTSKTYLDSTIVLPNQNKVMVIGSMITYFRRYHVTSMLGLTTETDNDAGGSKPGKQVSRSVETAGSKEAEVDFISIFTNMINKGKSKESVMKQYEAYVPKMKEEQVAAIITLIGKMS